MSDTRTLADLKELVAGTPAAPEAAIDWMVPAVGSAPRAAQAGAVPYLELWGLVAGAWQLARAAQIAARHLTEGTGDASFLHAKIATARYHAECLLPQAFGLAQTITHGGEAALLLPAEHF